MIGVSIEEAYETACRALGEAQVQMVLLAREIERLQERERLLVENPATFYRFD